MDWLTQIWNDMTGVTAANIQAQAATTAAGTESAATQTAIDEQKRQFDAMQELMRPWVEQGTAAMTKQNELLGLAGPDAQRAAIAGISQSPEMTALTAQGENAMIQGASATGGLRGGNFQGALAEFRPQLLSSLINQQYSRLGGVSQTGQAASAGLASGGMQNASSLGDLFMRQGGAIAGGQLAAGQGAANASNLAWQPVRDVGQLALAYGLKSTGAF